MSVISGKINQLATRGGGLFSKTLELMHNVLSNKKDTYEGRHTYQVWSFFIKKKRVLWWVDKMYHCCSDKCSNYVKRWEEMSVISRKLNKLATRLGGGTFPKIPELRHNVLSNEKDAIELRHNYHFCYIPRFFLNLGYQWSLKSFFCQKSAVSAGWVNFVICALKNAPIMENVG